MGDYRKMYDKDFLGAYDLDGKDFVVTIARVECKELVAQGNRKNKKPVVYFDGTTKGLTINKTNGKAISAMYGNDTDNWIGKRITIYPTRTDMAGESVECIRVRPTPPQDGPVNSKEKQRASA